MYVMFGFIMISIIAVISGCSQDGRVSSSGFHMKTFDNILTNQYREHYGQGGIYWVSNDHVVLEAYLETDDETLDRVLYEVNIGDGTYSKIVDIQDNGPARYWFCFDGSELHVMTKTGSYSLVNKPQGYSVVVSQMGKKNRNNRYSPLRCRFVDLPKEERVAYIPLREFDGFVKNTAGKESGDPVRAFVVDNKGNHLKELTNQLLDKRGVIGLSKYVPHADAYFGYTSFRDKCTYISTIFRNDWTLEQQKLCLGKWAASGSVIVHKLIDSFYVEHYTSKSLKIFIVDKDEKLIEDGYGRGASVSPNGCLVAYGVGKLGKPQQLRVFNACAHIGS